MAAALENGGTDKGSFMETDNRQEAPMGTVASNVVDVPEDYNLVDHVLTETSDYMLIAWWYGEKGEFAPIRVIIEDSEGDRGHAYLSPEDAERMAEALTTAVRRFREAKPALDEVLDAGEQMDAMGAALGGV